MKSKAPLLLVLLLILSLFGCDQSPKTKFYESDPNEVWVGNSKKIVVEREGETLGDLAHRLIGKKIDSLGIKPDDYYAFYQSGVIWLYGTAGGKDQTVTSVMLNCDNKHQISIGADFDGAGCGRESLTKLVSLANQQPAKFKEYCASPSYDPSQQTVGFVNIENHAFWKVDQTGVIGLGISSGKYYPLALEGELGACDLEMRTRYEKDQENWYIPNAIMGKVVGGCKISDGPAKTIHSLEFLNQPYRVANEIKVNGRIVQTTVEFINQGGSITFYRGKDSCENVANSMIINEKYKKNSIDEKYK